MTEWANFNQKLAQSLLVVGGSVLAPTAAIGGTSLAIGLLIGSLAKLQLDFTLQTGGATGTISAIRTLGTASSPAMASVSGWGLFSAR